MPLRPQPLPSVDEDTARVAHAALRRGNPYLLLRDRLGAMFGLCRLRRSPSSARPACLRALAPGPLVTLMQFREGLSDR